MTCASCGAFIRYLPRDRLKIERTDKPANHPALKPPPAGAEWLGFIRASDQRWRLVTMASTLAGVWDGLLTGWMDGDKLAIPCERE
jgi:hypothetical protein